MQVQKKKTPKVAIAKAVGTKKSAPVVTVHATYYLNTAKSYGHEAKESEIQVSMPIDLVIDTVARAVKNFDYNSVSYYDEARGMLFKFGNLLSTSVEDKLTGLTGGEDFYASKRILNLFQHVLVAAIRDANYPEKPEYSEEPKHPVSPESMWILSSLLSCVSYALYKNVDLRLFVKRS